MPSSSSSNELKLKATSNKNNKCPSNRVKPWPEDHSSISSDADATTAVAGGSSRKCCQNQTPRHFLRRQRNALFYSYMGPILNRGAQLHKQRKNVDESASNNKNKEQQQSWLKRRLSRTHLRSSSSLADE
eukprot:CAMPEP_0172323920 /NCGR_PEP_ID=MMETSP1058-20130122/49901_1 /TAXON_ID=83371 /ORGANISM="Detonula confervacea, Strain CCMP 353" /LENGTH=129 /DNA_ID=CAMNT_0013040041 /DNA_START=18 /DNA_END=404 /DNA_ORIENTATION=-